MAAKADGQKKNDELTLNERITQFIQKNRFRLFIGLGAIIVILVGFLIATTIREKLTSNALSKVYDFERKYEELKSAIESAEDAEAVLKQIELLVLVDNLKTFQNKNSGFPAARAYGISASIDADQKRWAEAEEAWTKAAKAAGKSYLAPVSLYNAAVAAEEQGKTMEAIALYNRALGYGSAFPSAARAQFSVGRLEESLGNRDAALEAYRNLLSQWPSDPVWPNLAQSRILVLSD